MMNRLRSSVALTVLLAACTKPPAPPPAADSYPITQPTRGAVDERTFVGQVQASRYVELRARHKGLVERWAVDEGQPVKAGQLIVNLGARELEQALEKASAAVESAEAELASARVELKNARLLFDNRVIAGVELEVAEARVQALSARVREAAAERAQAQTALGWARVVAPFDGAVNRLHHKVGAVVKEDDLLTTLTDTREVFVYFRVAEREYLADAAALSPTSSTSVVLRLADGRDYPHAGRIDAVDAEFHEATGTIAFRARFPNPDRTLKHGASGTIVLRRALDDVLVVPQRATFEVQGDLFVYVVQPDDTVRATRIEAGARTADAFVVRRGLSADDRVVLEGVQRLRDGARIAPRPQALSAL